jgi:hypothetical protein
VEWGGGAGGARFSVGVSDRRGDVVARGGEVALLWLVEVEHRRPVVRGRPVLVVARCRVVNISTATHPDARAVLQGIAFVGCGF